jgi:sn-glycerol 3-phosphate transport system permease protein
MERLLLVGAAAFVVIFVAAQRGGFGSLGALLRDAVLALPSFVQETAAYFAAAPAEQIALSLGVGAAFGLLATLFYARRLGDPSLPRSPHWLWIAACAGALAGGIGGQILMVPARHCTYAPAASGAEFRLGLFVTALSALLLLVPLWTLLHQIRRQSREHPTGMFRGRALPYLLLSPTVLFLALFLYYPTVQVMLVSLKQRIFPLPQERFACMQNYLTLAEDAVYRNSFSATLYITAFIVLISLSVALAIAVLAAQKVRGAAVYRTLLVWPYAISPVVTGVIFLSIFREGGTGILNWALDGLFGLEVRWLTDRQLAPWVIIASAVWNLLGFNILFYIAGLQNIPTDLLEAASLDGAGRSRRFWRITFPLLAPYTFFLLITNVTYSFYGIYGVVDTLTPEGGPRFGPGGESGATNVLIFKLYRDAFDTGAPAGFGAAQAVMLFLMVAALVVVQFGYIDRRVTYEG